MAYTGDKTLGIPGAARNSSTNVWSGTNSATEIQAAIDAFIAGTAPYPELAQGVLRITDGLHLGYGVSYGAGKLTGPGGNYAGEVQFRGVTLGCDFSDRPGISVQGTRRGHIEALGLEGLNYKHIADSTYGQLAGSGDTALATWVSGTLNANANSRYAPYAGVAVDPRSGTTPSPAYPVGGSIAYGRLHSSVVHMRDLVVRGFVVGVVINPSNDDGNADFVSMYDMQITYCAIGLSIGPTQARFSVCQNVYIALVHTGFTNRLHGIQTGKFGPEIINCGVEAAIQVFDFASLGTGGPIAFRGFYGESLWRMGAITANTSTEIGIIFDGCHFGFHLQSDLRGVPAETLDAAGQNFPCEFRGGAWSNFVSVCMMDMAPLGLQVAGTLIYPTSSRTNPYEKFAHNGTMGGLVLQTLSHGSLLDKINPLFRRYNLDTGADLGSLPVQSAYPSKRDRCTPLWVAKHVPSSLADIEPVWLPRRTSVRGASNYDGASTLVDKTLTLVLESSFTDDFLMVNGGLPGDVLLHSSSNSVFFVSARTTSTITAILQNNYVSDGSGGFDPIVAVDLAAGNMYFGNTRYYSPEYPVYATFTSGSPTLTNVGDFASVATFLEDNIGVGDYIAIDNSLSALVTIANSRITARSNAGATITLAGNASASSSGRVRIGSFIRTPPANV